MKAANRGLVAKALDAVVGVVKTILKLKDMLLNVLAKAADVIGDIISDPIGFLGRLVDGVKSGLTRFVDNIATHLENGLMGWLFGALGDAGIQMPKTFDLAGIFELVMDVLGLTYRNIRGKVAKLVGEPLVEKMEQTVDVFKTLATKGVAGLWEWIKEKVGDFQEMVLGGIKTFIIERVIKGGITWLLSLLNPAAAFIKACKAIYDIVMFIVERGQQIMEFVNSILDSIGAIARGQIGIVADKVEGALAKALPLAISFLASLLGLGGISDKIREGIEMVRKPIEKAIDFVVVGAVKGFKKLFGGAIGWVKGKYEKGKAVGQGQGHGRQGLGRGQGRRHQGPPHRRRQGRGGSAGGRARTRRRATRQGRGWARRSQRRAPGTPEQRARRTRACSPASLADFTPARPERAARGAQQGAAGDLRHPRPHEKLRRATTAGDDDKDSKDPAIKPLKDAARRSRTRLRHLGRVGAALQARPAYTTWTDAHSVDTRLEPETLAVTGAKGNKSSLIQARRRAAIARCRRHAGDRRWSIINARRRPHSAPDRLAHGRGTATWRPYRRAAHPRPGASWPGHRPGGAARGVRNVAGIRMDLDHTGTDVRDRGRWGRAMGRAGGDGPAQANWATYRVELAQNAQVKFPVEGTSCACPTPRPTRRSATSTSMTRCRRDLDPSRRRTIASSTAGDDKDAGRPTGHGDPTRPARVDPRRRDVEGRVRDLDPKADDGGFAIYTSTEVTMPDDDFARFDVRVVPGRGDPQVGRAQGRPAAVREDALADMSARDDKEQGFRSFRQTVERSPVGRRRAVPRAVLVDARRPGRSVRAAAEVDRLRAGPSGERPGGGAAP